MLHSTAGTQAHFVLELLAYAVGARVYWRCLDRNTLPPMPDRLLLLGAAILGAFVGSKLLHVAEHFDTLVARDDAALWLAGKSVLGGFLGGTLGSEIAKKLLHWTRPTGDAWVPALAAGLIIGRIGCQLSGTWDQTYGTPTALPWAWDYGDGIGRHPTALYEIVLVALSYACTRHALFQRAPGAPFAVFMLLYCASRLGLECLKPPFGAAAIDALPVMQAAGFTAIQWAAIIGIFWYGALLRMRLR